MGSWSDRMSLLAMVAGFLILAALVYMFMPEQMRLWIEGWAERVFTWINK